MQFMELRIRRKAILAGLYLSRFDTEGLKALGFNGFVEAFNVIGYAIGSKPASIKNYRDEFDPYYFNNRKGWHQRPLRAHCKAAMDEFKEINFAEFTDIIKSFLFSNYEIEKFIENVIPPDHSESVAKRLITGQSAEEYFRLNYSKIDYFLNFDISDTTKLACGFDFKLTKDLEFFCVEVKGISGKTGSIRLTEKEFNTAKVLKNSYCLFVVSNFVEKPKHTVFFNPIESNLKFKRSERLVQEISYSSVI